MKTPHRITGSILAIVFATTSVLPAAGIPQIKAPPSIKAAPRIVSPPKVPVAPRVPVVKVPSVPKVPTAPKVPVVRVPGVKVPKVPVVKVPVAPKIPTVRVPVVKVPVTPKIPVAPRIVKTPSAPKIPAVKTPSLKTSAVVTQPRITKTPVLVKTPQIAKTPVVRSAVVISKPSPVKTATGNSGNTIASITSAPPPDTRASVQGGNGSNGDSDSTKSKKKGRDFSDIEGAYRRQQESENADGGAADPYAIHGGFDRAKFQRDERLIAAFENEQTGAQDLLDGSKKPDPSAPDDDDKTPVAVTRGRIKDLSKIEGTGQLVGLKGNEPELVDAKDQVARGKVRDPKAVDRLVDRVANKGVDQQFGEAPDVDVDGLTRIGDALKKRGKLKQAGDYYDQAIDALKNGGKNSAKYRLGVIAEVGKGVRPSKDLDRVIKPGGPGKGSADKAPVAVSAPAAGAPAGVAGGSVGQNIGDRITIKDATKAPVADSSASSPAASPAPATTPVETPAANVGEAPQSGRDVAQASAPAAAPAAEAPSSQAPAQNAPTASVASPEDEIVLSSPGNNADFSHNQSNNDNTSTEVSHHPDGTFSVVVTTVTRDDQGNISSTTTQTITGTYTEGDDGQAHHTVTGTTTTTSDNSGNGNGNDDKDDDKNDSPDTPDADTSADAEPAETTESEDGTAEASEEGTPNPEARDSNGYTGRLADKTGGRLGGDEQRRQNGAIDQRKNGNGAGGPNPERNTSSGVLLTKEEQSAFAKNLGMKRGGGVTTPTEEPNTPAVTDRDLKDIEARLGSTINPAGDKGTKGGSGQALGKKGFAPAGGAPAPAPRGVQAARAANIQVDTVKVQQTAR